MGARTPGPWVVHAYPNIDAAKDAGEFQWAGRSDGPLGDCFDGAPVASVFKRPEGGGETGLPGSIETSLANAHLIAAAPDLLDALKVMEEYHHSNECSLGDNTAECLMMRAAIAKAEGR